jgi:hypothetical protein
MMMTLLELLVEKLPGRGGWPNHGILAVQDVDKWICFSTLPEVEIKGGEWVNNGGEWVSCIKNCEHLAEDYSKAIITREQYESALAASKPEWDGEGLPPVGCEFEFRANVNSSWNRGVMCVVDYTNPFNVVVDDQCGIYRVHELEFRPIRSEAEKKRYEVETELRTCLAGTGAGITRLAAKCIYDAIAAGKIPHIRID